MGLVVWPRRLGDSTDEGKVFVYLALGYILAGILALVFLFGGFAAWRGRVTRSKNEGAFGQGTATTGTISLIALLLGIVPITVLTTCCILGPILALAEGWSVVLGIEYMISNALGVSALSDIGPEGTFGKLASIIANSMCMTIVTASMGMVAGTIVVSTLAEKVPQSTSGLLLLIIVVIPICLMVFGFLLGMILAAVEDWSVVDGFYYMLTDMLGLGIALTSVKPESPQGLFIECIFISVEMAVAGAIVGIVSCHPVVVSLQLWIEGERGQEEGESNSAEAKEAPAEEKAEAAIAQEVAEVVDVVEAEGAVERRTKFGCC